MLIVSLGYTIGPLLFLIYINDRTNLLIGIALILVDEVKTMFDCASLIGWKKMYIASMELGISS